MATVVTGAGAALPGDSGPRDLTDTTVRPPDPVDPATRLPGRGLRYKDRATRLALCAASDALRDARLLTDGGLTVPGASIAVVASSNLGNLDTVCRVVDTIAADGASGTSPMDLPNASSNVVASSVAIRFGLRGPNLMVCNGATSGLDAIHWATTMIVSGRASGVLVLGVEPDHPVARRLSGHDRVLDGAAAVVVEDAETARRRGAPVRLRLGGYTRAPGMRACLHRLAALHGSPPTAWYVPQTRPGTPHERWLPGVDRHDLCAVWGASGGALGVLQVVAAIGRFDAGEVGTAYAVNGDDDQDAVAALLMASPDAPEGVLACDQPRLRPRSPAGDTS